MIYDPNKTYVNTSHEPEHNPEGWLVSYHTSTAFDGTRLNVFRIAEDESNEWGGKGVHHKHPEWDGLPFLSGDEARQFALDHGLIREYIRTPNEG